MISPELIERLLQQSMQQPVTPPMGMNMQRRAPAIPQPQGLGQFSQQAFNMAGIPPQMLQQQSQGLRDPMDILRGLRIPGGMS
jgi:hypothetical protein